MYTHLAKLQGLPAQRRRLSGFTLIELMVTAALAALLMGLATPAYMDLTRKFRINSVLSSVSSSLQTARAEAIKSNAGVIACARNSAGTDCAASTDWAEHGWMVCYDLDANGQCDASTARRLNPIRLQAPLAVLRVTGPAAGVRFDALGARPLAADSVSVTVAGSWLNAPSLATTVAVTGLIKGSKL